MRPIGRHRLLYVVVGTGRCGTVYFSKLLTAVGVPCGHERVFGPDGLAAARAALRGGRDSDVATNAGLRVPGTHVLADSSYMAVPYLDHPILEDAFVIHAVRNPVDVILSYTNKVQHWHRPDMNPWESFIAAHMPSVRSQPTPLSRNAHFVVQWNRWIEKFKPPRYARVPVEDPNLLLDLLEVPERQRPGLGVINDHGSWKHKKPPLGKPATAEDLLRGPMGAEVARLMRDYGY